MRVLLDTHVLYWLANDAAQVPERIQAAMRSADARYLSPVTAMEAALKARLGRMPGGDQLVSGWATVRSEMLALDTELHVEHLALAGSLNWDHRDPFDRMLVAQAIVDGLTLVTKDRAIARFPGVDTLSW